MGVCRNEWKRSLFLLYLYCKIFMTIENLNILCTMPFCTDKTKFYRVTVNTYRRKKIKPKKTNQTSSYGVYKILHEKNKPISFR